MLNNLTFCIIGFAEFDYNDMQFSEDEMEDSNGML